MGETKREPLLYKIEELSEESIFLCTKDGVEKVGELKEVTAYTPNFIGTGAAIPRVGTVKVTANKPKTTLEANVEKIISVSQDTMMSFSDVTIVMEVVLGVQLHSLTEEDIDILANKVFAKLAPLSKVKKFLEKHKFTNRIRPDFFSTYALQYPLGANKNINGNTINRFLNEYFSAKG